MGEYELEANRLWQLAWNFELETSERQLAVDRLAELHSDLLAAAARDKLDESGLRGLIAIAFHLNGLPPELTREVSERLALLESAADAARQLALIETEVNSLWRLARLLLSLGDVDGARTRLEQAQPKLDRAPAMKPWVLLDLGACSRLAGRWDEALSWLERAEASLDRERFEVHALARASVYGEFFEIYLAWGTPDQARVWLERERDALEAAPARPEAEYVHAVHVIDQALAAEDWNAALTELDRCLSSPELLRVSPDAEAKLLLRRALVWNQAGIAAADRTAETFLQALDNPALRGKERLLSLLFFAYLELGLGRLDEAEELLERAREPLDEVDVKLVDAAYQRAFFQSIESRIALARDEPVEVLRGLLDRAHAAFDGLLEEWGRTPLLPGGIGFLSHGRRRGILSQLFQLELRVHGPERGAQRAFSALLRTHELGSIARSTGAESIDLASIRAELLTSGEALLVFFPAPDVSHLFVVDAKRLVHHALPESVRLREAQTTLIRALATRPQRDSDGHLSAGDRKRWLAAATRLSDLVLPAAVVEDLQSRRALTVIGFDLRAWFPIECLPLPSGELVGELLAVSHLPSLTYGLELSRKARSRTAECEVDMCLFAAPKHSGTVARKWPSIQPLPQDQGSFDRLTESYERTRQFTGPAASPSSLGELPTTAVLQLLCHGVYDPSRLMPAGLVLSPTDSPVESDGILWFEEAARMGSAKLVLLTACGAGRGPQRRGDEAINHLGGAFLAAGADAVLQAHTDLDYEGTLRLSQLFHSSLSQPGTTPADALRWARAELRRDPRFDHPHFSSLLQVVGLGHRPLFE